MIRTMNGPDGAARTEQDPQNLRAAEPDRQVPPKAPVDESRKQVVDTTLGYRLVQLDRVVGSPNSKSCRALLTVAGLDRTGLIAAVSRLLLDLELNIEGSFGALLEDGQGLIFLISGSESNMRRLEQKVEEIDGKSFRGFRIKPGRRYELSVVTRDEPGIVCKIAEALLKYDVNLSSIMSRNTVAATEQAGDEWEVQAVIIMTIEVPTDCPRTKGQLLDEVRSLFQAPRKVCLERSTNG